MPNRRRSTLNIRKAGLAMAFGLLLVSAGVVGLLATRGRPAQGPGTTGSIAPAVVPEIPAAPIDVAAEGLRNAGRARFQFVARNDPARVLGQMEWAALEPLGEGRALVAEPRATIFLNDGLVGFIRARRGRIFTPPGTQQPESGSFEGGVPIAVFAPDSAGRIDVDRDRPIALLFSPVLNFNLALGEITLPERFRLSTARLEMSGKGVRILGDQVAGRIELLEIEQTDGLRLAADGLGLGGSGSTSNPATSPAPATTPPVTDAATPGTAQRQDFYRLVLDRRVRAIWRDQSLRADRLEAWTELVDGALPSGAIGGLPASSGSGRSPLIANAEPGSRPPSGAMALDADSGEPASLAVLGADPVRVTWDGALRVKPSARRPVELERERAAVRLSSERTGAVIYADERTGQRLQAADVEYGATTRTLALSGTGPRSVIIGADGRGRLEVEQFELNLGTGVGVARGTGVLSAAGEERVRRGQPAEPTRQVSWSDQADVILSVRDGWITGGLSEAMFAGKVLAESGRASISAGFVRAIFTPSADAGGTPRLARLEARENVLIDPRPSQSLRAQRIDVAFEPSRSGRSDEPSLVTASGRVTAQADLWRVDSGLLEARLIADDRGERTVGPVRFEQNVRIRGPKGTEALADKVETDVPTSTATLTGRSVSLSREGATIQGTQLALDGNNRRLLARGPGTFRYFRERGKDQFGGTVLSPMGRGRSGSPVRVDASWSRELKIDDAAGTVELVGDARATSNPTPTEIDTLIADRLLLAFTPSESDAGMGTLGEVSESSRRRLLRAEAFAEAAPQPAAGESAQAEPGTLARIESRRYAEAAGDADVRTLERMVFVEGARIAASETEGRIEVPGAGRLLIDDRRAAAVGAAPANSPVDFGDGRGTSLFSWQGGLSFDRLSGQIEMLRQVRLLHRAGLDRPLTTLDCDRITAMIRSMGSAGVATLPLEGGQAELISAAAEGAVVLQNEDRQLSADLLKLDAINNLAEATAAADNRVTLFDPARPQPLSARRMIWDLSSNRVTIQEPAPITIPR